MKTINRTILGAALAAMVVGVIVQSPQPRSRISVVGDADALRAQYESWKSQLESGSGRVRYEVSLVSPRTHVVGASESGRATFDFESRSVAVELSHVEDVAALDVWVTSGIRVFEQSVDPGAVRRVGRMDIREGVGMLNAAIATLMDEKFAVDQVLVARPDSDPLQQPVLVGSLNLFQRLYAAEMTDGPARHGSGIGPIATADASVPTGYPGVFSDLVAQGEDLFFNEPFAGNGRSCGTCHPATNNFTIDPAFIATLPPSDPLFVAETVPALIFGNPANLDGNGHPRRFENPALMRTFGLIVENLDGMDDLENRFVMRSVPHNIGMSVSITRPPNDRQPPDQRTGWSGDGAPSGLIGGIATSGRLRDFIVGAIVQHYPKTMNRSFSGPAPDFRAPTSAELDALEAFMLSLGRQSELQLAAAQAGELILKDAEAEAGKVLFRDGVTGGTRTCNGCHGNAGANVIAGANPGNRNFNTGVELFLRNRLADPTVTVIGEPRPVDGGFGTDPSGNFTSITPQPGFTNENFGDGRFNSTSLVEAADSGPFFHNNVISDLEDAIRFYASPEFVTANGGIIPFDDAQVVKVGKFLRVINAIDNIENSSLRAADRALAALQVDPNPDDVIHRILQIAIADTEDAMNVLNSGGLHNTGGLAENAVKQLERALQRFQQAMNIAAPDTVRVNHVGTAKVHLANALALMRQ